MGTHVLSGGKSGYIIVLNSADTSQTQLLGVGDEVLNVAAWNGGAADQFVYTWPTGARLSSWQLTGGMLTNQTTNTEGTVGHPGGMITISSNGVGHRMGADSDLGRRLARDGFWRNLRVRRFQ